MLTSLSRTILFLLVTSSLSTSAMATEVMGLSTGENESNRASLIFTGDIFLGNWAEAFIDSHGVGYPFAACDELFHSVDLVVGNLESPITRTGSPIVEKQYLLTSPPGIEAGLHGSNIRAVNLANNHVLDYGFEGLRNTFNALDSKSIKYFGAGFTKQQALQEAVVEINGITIGLLGFSATFPEEYWASDSTGGTAFPYGKDVKNSVLRCDSLYDHVIVSFHWSAEKRMIPKEYQTDLAHTCIDLGADAIIGHHPHVPQGIEIYKGKPVYYSLGNFAFASYSESAKVGLLARLELGKKKILEATVLPVNVYNAERNFQPIPLIGTQMNEVIETVKQISDSLNSYNSVLDNRGTIFLSETIK